MAKNDFPCACSTLRKASRAVSRYYEACLAPTNTTATQFAILRLLEREGPQLLSRMAEKLELERTSLYRSISPLESEKLVVIKPHQSDSRAKIASLTKKGHNKIDKIVPYWNDAQASFIKAVGASWLDVSSSLDDVVSSLHEAELV